VATSSPRYWLFSAPVDLGAFLGSAALSLVLLAWGAHEGLLYQDTPEWAWIPFVLLIDVAHVYATGFRVYFDRNEFQQRATLYVSVPIIAFILAVALYSEGELIFWRVVAYLAVFHFVRQQYGWVALYRARVGETSRWGRYLDTTTIYLATLYPLIYWHAHLPRRFWWLLDKDFASLPEWSATVLAPVYWAVMVLYLARATWLWSQGKPNPGKDIVVATTAVCWYVGIIAFNSDYAFTVTNVIIHGVPYMVLVYWYWRSRDKSGRPQAASPWLAVGWFLATVWLLAYAEEMLWDRLVWQERGWLFGSAIDSNSWLRGLLIPLLIVPQVTHYILDGFIWKRRHTGFVTIATARS
jgi:hypothetical protein